VDDATSGSADRAWEAARRAADRADVRLRRVEHVEDADAILRVLHATWGGHDPFPREVVLALADSGNAPIVATADGDVIGYVLGWVGVEPQDGLHVHSHMLAALPDRRHAGVGFALKLAQRAQALEQGIALVRWTFDPLVARNAYFNLHKLGAIADRFGRDFYGQMSDAVNAGERSDRFTVRWDLERDPGPRAMRTAEVVLANHGGRPRATGVPSGPGAIIEIPREYPELRATEPVLAAAWRDATADAIETCFAAGMVAAGFDAERSAYVLVRREAVPG
jgi:predicted GNAT superfamily acetyltransferase